MRETDLYAPIKAFLEGQGYEVKGEIGPADVVAVRGDEDPLIVELKTGFSLSLFHQAIARLSVCDTVYVAVPRGAGKRFGRALKDNVALARRLGIGVITVRLSDGLVEVHADPGPYQPRKNPRRKASLLREFARRRGDPTRGGATREGLVTAYRQDAMAIRDFLCRNGPSRGAEVARETGVATATRVMRDNHYGWFEKEARGVYRLAPNATEPEADSSPTQDAT